MQRALPAMQLPCCAAQLQAPSGPGGTRARRAAARSRGGRAGAPLRLARPGASGASPPRAALSPASGRERLRSSPALRGRACRYSLGLARPSGSNPRSPGSEPSSQSGRVVLGSHSASPARARPSRPPHPALGGLAPRPDWHRQIIILRGQGTHVACLLEQQRLSCLLSTPVLLPAEEPVAHPGCGGSRPSASGRPPCWQPPWPPA